MRKILQKLSLENCDLPDMLWDVCCLLRPLLLNLDSRNKKKIPIIFYVIFVITFASYFYVYLVSMSWFVFYKCRETGDLIAGMISLSLGISSEIGPFKLYYMLFYEKVIKTIVEGYLTCDALNRISDRFSKKLLKTMKIVKKRALIFWIVIIGNGVIYVIKPIILPGRHLMEDSFLLYGLDPLFESPNYEIAFVTCSFGVLCTVYLPANISGFFIVLIGYTEATMLALSEELVNVWTDAEIHYKNNYMQIEHSHTALVSRTDDTERNRIKNAYVKQRLEEIIKIHTTNINLIKQIEYVFRGAIAVEFLLLISGLIAELLGGLENTYIEMPFAFMQVSMDCVIGQWMMDSCVKFENSVYDCQWENFNVANMKTVLLMLQNSQKTLVLSAGGMTTLSLSCLMTVIRSIYSAYTTLRTTMA